MKKGDKLRVIVHNGDGLLMSAPLASGQIVEFKEISPPGEITIRDKDGGEWYIDPKAVEAV